MPSQVYYILKKFPQRSKDHKEYCLVALVSLWNMRHFIDDLTLMPKFRNVKLSLPKQLQMIKKPSESLIVMTELVLPNDTNLFGNLMGGRLMYWMDIAAALSGSKHSNAPVVTASVDNISFTNPIKLGNVVHIEAKVSRVFNTSMEVHIEVWGEDILEQYRYKSNEAYYTFVAMDVHGKPKMVSQLEAETEKEKELFDSALRRRQLRLILAGKMKADDASELKALFNLG